MISLEAEERGLDLLAIYEMTEGYEGFCAWLRIDPDDPASLKLFDATHSTYVDTWTQLGEGGFDRLMEERKRLVR